jgi:hypothetical protein
MKNSETGELLVVGKGSLSIALKKRPRKASIRFVGDCDPTPCNIPVSVDSVEGSIVEKGAGFLRRSHYLLVIRWDVSSERAVVWETFE